ncbi:MAG: fibrobacter succinogenes major paralogous domain-containing protein [Alistipes sp.]|nr:fibrobacter succinogenes major paralogous domain-containing protein [Alistipes sp.]
MLFASASGYRGYTTGALTNVGTQGDYWSSSPGDATSANADGMWFDSGSMVLMGGTNRSYGFTVRCVQHLRLLFILSQQLPAVSSEGGKYDNLGVRIVNS